MLPRDQLLLYNWVETGYSLLIYSEPLKFGILNVSRLGPTCFIYGCNWVRNVQMHGLQYSQAQLELNTTL